MELKKKFEKETALKELQEMKRQIVGENILELLESDDVQKEIEDVKPGDFLLAATMGGLVYFDETSKCLVQKLIKPIQSGEQSADTLYYKNNLSLGMMRDENTSNEIALSINLITRLTGRTKQLIEKINGQDVHITNDIATFFFA